MFYACCRFFYGVAACAQVEAASKVERGNMAAFTKLLELDPEADSEDALFTTES